MTDETPAPDAPDAATRSGDEETAESSPAPDREALTIGQSAKIMRIGTMVKQLLEEVRAAPLDDAARERLATVHERSLRELEDGLSPDLVDELRRISLPFTDEQPSDAELRIAQAQLVGWLEGLFHGLQTALMAQQLSSQAQLAQMRRALPPGTGPGAVDPRAAGVTTGSDRSPGHYL